MNRNINLQLQFKGANFYAYAFTNATGISIIDAILRSEYLKCSTRYFTIPSAKSVLLLPCACYSRIH